jgi:hypothetical protein
MAPDSSSTASGSINLQIFRTLASLGTTSSDRDVARKFLAVWYDPRDLIRFAYGARYHQHRTGPIWGHLKRKFPTRWQFVHWVYGDHPERLAAAYKDQSWLRTASQSDTLAAIVDCLLQEVKPRYPWMWRRTLYGYAYGQHRGAGKYTRKVIHPHKGKRRVLYVPHKPLARVHKALLRHVLNPAQESLPVYVMGGRASKDGHRNEYGIFQNAAAHVGQGFIASFDVRDFFPSVQIGDVVRALSELTRPALWDIEGSALSWTADAATFVARLVTRRGRLPQGAPTSPAIANLVFSRYDERIRARLGNGFVYTRYFDDLTISVSERDARLKGFATPTAFRTHVADVISQVLSRSSFRLNPKKSRCGRCTDGVVVTGLRVDTTRVNVSRPLRRSTRALLHRIESSHHGFVAAAIRHYDNSRFFDTRFDAHRDSHHDTRRRLSAERMAVMAVRNLCGDLKIEVPGQVTLQNGRRIAKDVALHEGKQAYRDVAYLLSRAWQLHLSTDSDEGHVVFRDADGRVVARLRCERNDGFFLLEKKAAFACMELWHQLNGLWSGMNPRSHEAVFRNVHVFRENLRESLNRISIPRGHHSPQDPVTPPEDGEIISVENSPAGVMKRNAGPLWNLLIAFRDMSDARRPLPAAVAALTGDFKSPVSRVTELAQWLQACRAIVNATCEVLPAPVRKTSSVWQTLCILDDRLSGKRSAFYEVERKAVKDAWFRARLKGPRYDGAVRSLPDEIAGWIQATLVAGMYKGLEDSVAVFREQGREQWQKTVKRNSDTIAFERQAEASKRRLREAVGAARWANTGKPVFHDVAVEKLTGSLEQYFREPSEGAPQVVLDSIWALGDGICGPIVEQLSDNSGTVSDTARIRLRKKLGKDEAADLPRDLLVREELLVEAGRHAEVLDVIQAMRNWHSHDDDTGKHDEWVRIVKYVAKALGRHCDLGGDTVKARGQRNFATAADLPLTPFEAIEAMLVICDRVADAMESLIPKTKT